MALWIKKTPSVRTLAVRGHFGQHKRVAEACFQLAFVTLFYVAAVKKCDTADVIPQSFPLRVSDEMGALRGLFMLQLLIELYAAGDIAFFIQIKNVLF